MQSFFLCMPFMDFKTLLTTNVFNCNVQDFLWFNDCFVFVLLMLIGVGN